MPGFSDLTGNMARTKLHYQRYGLRGTIAKILLRLLAAGPAQPAPAETYQLPFVFPLRLQTRKENVRRINLLIPSLEKRHVFGGIATALSLFAKFAPHFDEARLIITDSLGGDYDAKQFAAYQLAFVNDRQANPLAVGAGDCFIASAWWTAYILQSVLTWQQAEFGLVQTHYFYLIQDYEPGFYPWSSLYALAESTYRSPHRTVALFNTTGLKEFFVGQGYRFFEALAFEPAINPELAEGAKTACALRRAAPYQLLVYGRPSVDRNCFSLIVEALRCWCRIFPNHWAWSIVSAGEPHPEILLTAETRLKAMGKLSLADYQQLLVRSSVGLSLMMSPHPSYPPLEMAAYGLDVITNPFGNKDLSLQAGNIRSVAVPTPENIAEALAAACRRVEAAGGAPLAAERQIWGASGGYDELIDKLSIYF